jgi:hypothetical protein
MRVRKILMDIGTCILIRIPKNGALQSYPPCKKNFVLEIQIYMEEECNERIIKGHDDDMNDHWQGTDRKHKTSSRELTMTGTWNQRRR